MSKKKTVSSFQVFREKSSQKPFDNMEVVLLFSFIYETCKELFEGLLPSTMQRMQQRLRDYEFVAMNDAETEEEMVCTSAALQMLEMDLMFCIRFCLGCCDV